MRLRRKTFNIFDKEAVTGLRYEPCSVDNSNSYKAEEVHRGNLYIATVEFGIPQHASDIFPRSWCQEHHIIVSFDKCNLITRRKDVLDYDFQKLDRLIAKGQEYYYINPWWFISRKVLKILLENKVVGLKRYGIYLKQKFEPVVFD